MVLKTKFTNWIDRLNKTECPEADIIAYNFGLYQANCGYSVYLIGSKIFDENNDDWAVNKDFESMEVLQLDGMKDDWRNILESSKDVLLKYIRSKSFERSFLKNAQAITVGFD